MKSDETAYQELFEELEKYENKGVYISMDGFPASPMQIVAAHMTREEGCGTIFWIQKDILNHFHL